VLQIKRGAIVVRSVSSLARTSVFSFLLWATCQSASAITITYQAFDLIDSVPGQDLWQYSYSVSDHSFASATGFSIYFDFSSYAQLESPPPSVNAEWDALTIQPDPGLPGDGIYDALALVDNAYLSDPFTVEFIWLGSGEPGAQYFEIYDTNFSTMLSGTTQLLVTAGGAGQTQVPEPPVSVLLAAGLLSWMVARRKFYQKGLGRAPIPEATFK
jgi:hypothetical protein